MDKRAREIQSELHSISELLKTGKKAKAGIKAQLLVTKKESRRSELKLQMRYLESTVDSCKKIMVELRQELLELDHQNRRFATAHKRK